MNELWHQLSGLSTTLALGSTAVLGAGLAGAYLFRRAAARAHAILALATGLAIAVPLLIRVGQDAGLGILPGNKTAGDVLPIESARNGAPALDDLVGVTALGDDAPVTATTSPNATIAADRAAETQRGMAGLPALPAYSFVALWLLLSCAALARIGVSVIGGLRLFARATPVDDPSIKRKLERAAARLQIRSSPLVRRVSDVASPVIWCWGRRPVLLLPEVGSNAAAATSIEWESVFCHELAHWKRRDHVSMLLAESACCIVPWNPLAWAARRHIAQLADRACDEYVLAAGFDETDYADSLLRFVPTRHPALALGAVSSRSGLARRIEAILTPRNLRPAAGRTWLAGLAGLALLACTSAILLHPAPLLATPQPTQENPDRPATDAESLAKRLETVTADDWREAYAIGNELASLPGDDGLEILAAHWADLPGPARQQMLKAWNLAAPYPLHQRMHPRLLDVLNLGMTDAAPDVQNWSIGYLRAIAFQDFSTDFQAYQKWYSANRERPLLDVMREECRRYVTSLTKADGKELEQLAKLDTGWVFRDVPQLAEVAREAGILDTFTKWMRDPALGTDATMRRLDRMLPYAGADEAYLRSVVLNAARSGPNLKIRATAIRTIGKQEYGWAVEPLRQMLVEVYQEGGETSRALLWTIGQALGDMNDPSVIPTILAIIETDDTYDTVYGLGYFALGKLTGVPYDESHNGAWWKSWWTQNSMRYPAVSNTPAPAIQRAAAAKTTATGGDQDASDDVKDVPCEDIKLGKDENRRYFLIGFDKKKQTPKNGYKLLVVLPGGDGSADFNPFVKRIWKNALPEGYLIAQPVAPKWSDDENRIVWPTRLLPDEKMKFSTEEFVKQVVADVEHRAGVNKKSVFALGWSSGGPPVYTSALLKDSPIRGAFIAMSVYKPELLPDRSAAKGRPFYLLHSPQDFIKMSFPKAAERDLKQAGAMVKLETYEGGHGWRGDVFGMIRSGVDWLMEQSADDETRK